MVLVVTYDVNTTTPAGARRLRKVANICEKYGIRVQNSVLEVNVDAVQLIQLKNALSEQINSKEDSIRLYRLGNSYQNKIETMGKTGAIQTGEPLLL